MQISLDWLKSKRPMVLVAGVGLLWYAESLGIPSELRHEIAWMVAAFLLGDSIRRVGSK